MLPLLLLLAAFWALIGLLLARYFKQAGYQRPFSFKGRDLQDRDIYGGGVGFGREVGMGGRGRDVGGLGRSGNGDEGGSGRVEGGYGVGRVKGL